MEFDEFRDAVVRLTGTDFGMKDPGWLARVGTATFQADRYREGRILLAGDAGHVHYPMGGQGLNLGVQDAMNLGWKLGAVVTGVAAPHLLDTYNAERYEVGRVVIDDTLAQTGLVAMPGREGHAVRAMMTAALAGNKELNAQFATDMSGLGVAYPDTSDPTTSHAGTSQGGTSQAGTAKSDAQADPLVGTRVPNLVLGNGRLYPHMADAKFQLIGVQAGALADQLGVAGSRLTVVPQAPGRNQSPWDEVGAVLVRPDGYAAWVARRGERVDADDAAHALLHWLAK